MKSTDIKKIAGIIAKQDNPLLVEAVGEVQEDKYLAELKRKKSELQLKINEHLVKQIVYDGLIDLVNRAVGSRISEIRDIPLEVRKKIYAEIADDLMHQGMEHENDKRELESELEDLEMEIGQTEHANSGKDFE